MTKLPCRFAAIPFFRRHTADTLVMILAFVLLAPARPSLAVAPSCDDPGRLDLSFGTGGKITTSFGANTVGDARAIAIQDDGKIVTAGFVVVAGISDFALARHNEDGTLDTSFGTGGKVTTDFAGDSDEAFAMVVQPDGKIVAAGRTTVGLGSAFALARYNPDGSLDPSFGTAGTVTTAVGGGFAEAVVLQPDGKIVAAGRAFDPATGEDDFAILRYEPDGSLDPSFGTGGAVTTDFAGHRDQAKGLVLQTGKILAAGFARDALTGEWQFALARYDSDGSLDPSFGTGGKVLTGFGGSFAQALAVVLQGDGQIVATGSSQDSFALARYNADGSLDPSFGTGGKVTTAFGGGPTGAEALALQGDGKIVAAGRGSSPSDFALARYNGDGTLDTSFGTGGKVTTDFAGQYDDAHGVALQTDGKIVAVGRSGDDWVLVRYRTVADAVGPNAIRPGFDSNALPGNDDGSSGFVPLGFPVKFFGNDYSGLYVNNNGNVTFDLPLMTYTPFNLTSTGRVIVAPFFADVDTRVGNTVTYGTGSVGGCPAFAVNWPEVGCFDLNASVLNTFQVVLIDRSDVSPGSFDIEFNYEQIQWETGQASGGDGSCLGGDSARVGYSNGSGNPNTSYELPGSGVPGSFLDSNLATGLIHNSLNSTQRARYVFGVRGPSVCGNGVAEQGEQCDDGATNGTLRSCCSATCQFHSSGNTCDDRSGCTQADECDGSGACVGTNPVICTAGDQCHLAGTCDAGTGACSTPPAPDGAMCSDGNACTQTDTCQGGSCVGSNPVVCMPSDQCHIAGTCSPATGCSNPPGPSGTACEDGNPCTGPDTCDGQGQCNCGPLVLVGEPSDPGAAQECLIVVAVQPERLVTALDCTLP